MKISENDPLYLKNLSARALGGRAFLIKTAPAIYFFHHLERWLTTGMLGAIVYGRPRLGKTSASRWVLQALRSIIGFVPWIEIPVRKQHLTSERAFFQHLLHCANNKHYMKGSAADRRDRFRELLVMLARRSPLQTVILFFDEAQLLNEMHYSWLMNICNEAEVDGYRIFCLLVGQQQLFTRRNTFMSEGLEEIVGRFMTEAWIFPGIETYKDFEACIDEFDNVIFPVGSNVPFIAHFIPKAYQSGWRLNKITLKLWTRFDQQWKESDRDGNPIIPMHYFSAAITNLLNIIISSDNENFDIEDKKINSAVDRSGFKNAVSVLIHKVIPVVIHKVE